MNDVIVIGGGPAGSTVGSYLAKAGLKTTILETLNHPRAHVGESLVMSTYRIFKDIDFLEVMENESFVKKFGASWHSPNGKEFKAPFDQFDQEGIPQYYTWHVDRSKFDLHLLKQAEKLGAQVYQGVHVKQVLMENDRAVGVRVSIAGSEVDIPAKFVVDASGRGTLLGNQLKIKVKDPVFDQYAVHAWYKNVDRGEDDSVDFIHIYFLPIERGWVWQIPITDEITSMGVVADKKVFRENFNDIESYFYANMKTNPRLEQAMSSAVRINEWKTEGDYSYCMSKFVGNNWLLVGDAARLSIPFFRLESVLPCTAPDLPRKPSLRHLRAAISPKLRLSITKPRSAAVLKSGTNLSVYITNCCPSSLISPSTPSTG
jgi:1H-pyrrole-2-carbonyl-[peptidyl-carrier protein] chlorinase